MTLKGFTECETCGGKGFIQLHDPNGEPNPSVCPDCVGGWQPDPAIVEAVANGLPDHGQTLEMFRIEARAALLAYAREVSEKP